MAARPLVGVSIYEQPDGTWRMVTRRRGRFLQEIETATPPTGIAPIWGSAPVVTSPIFVGDAAAFTTGAITGIPTPTVTYQWRINGTVVAEATGYTPILADIGKNLTVRQTATNTSGTASITSAAVVVQAAETDTPPTWSANPVVSGSAFVGQFFTVSDGVYAGTAPITVTYQWQTSADNATWANISGQTTNTSPVWDTADVYKRCRVTLTNAQGSAVYDTPGVLIVVESEDIYTYLGYGTNPADRVVDNRIVLQKHSSARYVFVDPVDGNNAWDGLYGVRQGLSTNGPKKDLYYALRDVARHGFGDWVLIAKDTDPSTGLFVGQLHSPQGLNVQHPTLISTYDKADWQNTAKYRVGTFNLNSAAGVTFNSMVNVPTTRREHKYLVIENFRSAATPNTATWLAFAGPGDGVFLENGVLGGRMLYKIMFSYTKMDGTHDLTQTNFAARRVNVHKAINQGIFVDKGSIGFWTDLCIIHGCGYDGDLRNSPGQIRPPTVREHGIYTYSENHKATRCILSHNANFGISARRGLIVNRSLFADNGGHVIVAGASTDFNESYGDVSCNIQNNAFSGMSYINGVNYAGGANGAIIAITRVSESTDFVIQNNIANNASRLISPYQTNSYSVAAGTSTSAYLATYKLATVNTIAGLTGGVSTVTRTSPTPGTFTFYKETASVLKLSQPNNTLQVGDVLTNGSTWTATVSAVNTEAALEFDAILPSFNANITRNCGAQPFAQTLDNQNGTAAILSFVRTNNVVDAAADATGSNVTYASVASTYLDPTRDAETYAATLGYASSKAWLDWAVLHPETDHCTPALNWIRAGFNLAPIY